MAEPLAWDAIRLLLDVCELQDPKVTERTLQTELPAVGEALRRNGFIRHVGVEPAVASGGAGGDVLEEVVWNAERQCFGYHDSSHGWVSVLTDDLGLNRVDFPTLIATLLSAPAFDADRRNKPLECLPDLLWDAGTIRIPGENRRRPVWFARRAANERLWTQLRALLVERPDPNGRVVLTTSRRSRFPRDVPSHNTILSLHDLLRPGGGLTVDPDVLALRLTTSHLEEPTRPLWVSEDGTTATLRGKVFRFGKGSKQRQIVRHLYDRHLQGEPEVASARLLEAAESGSPRIANVFKGNRAWNNLLTEKNGITWFLL